MCPLGGVADAPASINTAYCTPAVPVHPRCTPQHTQLMAASLPQDAPNPNAPTFRPSPTRAITLGGTPFQYKTRAASQPAGERFPIYSTPSSGRGTPGANGNGNGNTDGTAHGNGYGVIGGTRGGGRFGNALAGGGGGGTATRASSFSAGERHEPRVSLATGSKHAADPDRTWRPAGHSRRTPRNSCRRARSPHPPSPHSRPPPPRPRPPLLSASTRCPILRPRPPTVSRDPARSRSPQVFARPPWIAPGWVP